MPVPIDRLADYDARPNQTLKAHLTGVRDNAECLCADAGQTATEDDWARVMRVLAWTHDAGKLTSYFQTYLDTGTRSHTPRKEYTYHGFVSALLAGHVLHRLELSPAAQTAGFYAVLRHHGVLPNLEQAHPDYTGQAGRVDALYQQAAAQLKDIDTNAAPAADALLRTASDGVLSWADVYVSDPGKYKAMPTEPAELDTQFYETLLRAWSTLVCADKLDAAGVTVPDSTQRPDIHGFRERIDDLPDGESQLETELNTLRQQAHDSCYQTLLEQHAAGDRVFQLTLPTGFGKTLTGLRAGLELTERTQGRVIYALPYTSILDQVDGVCQEFLDVDPLGDSYTLHHHLADTRTTNTESNSGAHFSDGSESLFAETWQAGLVLTTFTQLFESVAGPGNTQSMKLPALQDSVIILDEPQGIALEWWNLVGRLAAFLTREYDATIIMMTATQPQLFEHDPTLPDPTPLSETTTDCVEFLSAHPRVEFDIHDTVVQSLAGGSDSTISHGRAADEIMAAAADASNTLAVVNTVESAATLTEQLQSHSTSEQPVVSLGQTLLQFYHSKNYDPTQSIAAQAGEYLQYTATVVSRSDPGVLLVTLTTRLRPQDRKLLLAALRRLLADDTATPFEDWTVVTVSTQLIEAGVDVSFDRLFRDFAPVPALVQAAGRCNREFGGQTRRVTLWRLASPDDTIPTPPSELIYGQQSLLRPARQALTTLQDKHGQRIPEAALIDTGVKNYYQALHEQRRTADRADRLVQAFNTADGQTLRELSLISEDYATQDVVVLCSRADVDSYRAYTEYKTTNAFGKARDSFTALKPLIVTMPVDDDGSADDGNQLAVANVTSAVGDYDIATGRGVAEDVLQFPE